MARSERETKEEEGRRLILKGLAMRPDLIGDLRKRVAVEAEIERREALRRERLGKRIKTAGVLAATAAAGFFLARLKPGPNRQASVQAPARQAPAREAAPAQAQAQIQAQQEAQTQRQAQALAQARQQAQQAAAQAQAQAARQAAQAQAQRGAQARAREAAQAKARAASTVRRGRAGIEWVRIPGGTFMMGRRDNSSGDFSDAQPHQVSVPSFWMAKTLVTNKQYRACVAAGACAAAHDCGQAFDGDDQPVVCVDWSKAQAFSRWAGGRLPSEAEWEYAARSGGKDWKYPWGDDSANCSNVVISGCGWNATAPVCTKPAGNTRQGLCDMAGNAWEWVEDWYHDSYNGAPTDGSAWVDPAGPHRVIRGSSWGGVAAFERSAGRYAFLTGGLARSAYRYALAPGYRASSLGFRPARERRD